jgi:predicted dehydrogenase
MGNWGAHWLDVARWFLDVTYPTAVSGAGGMFVLNDIKEWPDTQTVLYDFPGVTLLWEQRIWSEASVNQMGGGCEFQGEKGSMYINRGGWTFAPREGRPVKHPGSELDVAHVTNFAQAIQGKASLAAPIVEGHRSAALCHLGNLSVIHSARLEWDAESERITNHAAAAAESERIWRAPWQDVQMKS